MFKWKAKASNAVFLDEGVPGKGRTFQCRFLEAGLVKYSFGVCLLTQETINKFIYDFVGCPVIIDHKDVTKESAKDDRVGVISEVWFNEYEGMFYCKGIIFDDEAIELINSGYNVSCQYEITEYAENKTNALHNGNPYDKVILNGKPEHLAIVKNPRYENAMIAVNAIEVAQNEDRWITIHPNGEDSKGKHLLLKDGESPKEAIERTYGKKEEKETGKEELREHSKLRTMDKEELIKTYLIDKDSIDPEDDLKFYKQFSRSNLLDRIYAKKEEKETSKEEKQDKKEQSKDFKNAKKVNLKDWEKELLREGNTYTFAELLARHYPKEAKKLGLIKDKEMDYVNTYKRYIEYDKDNDDYVVRYDNGDKAFFDTNFKLKGYKAYNEVIIEAINEIKETDMFRNLFKKEKKQMEKSELKELFMECLEDLTARNEAVDKRKLIDEIGGILKDKVDDEIIRTIIKKAEELSYNPSEKDKADNEQEEIEEEEKEEKKEEVKNKCGKNEEEDAENKCGKNEDKKDDEEDKKEAKNAMEEQKNKFYAGNNQSSSSTYLSKSKAIELGDQLF